MIKTTTGLVIQLNKEMVNSFTIDFENKTYNFLNLEGTGQSSISGFVNVLYSGNISLFVKYKKEIFSMVVENQYDLFEQSHRIYIRKDNVMYLINRKHDLVSLFQNNQQQIKSFMRTHRIKVSKNNPEGIIPLVDFFNSI
jgi:hypothetical protein